MEEFSAARIFGEEPRVQIPVKQPLDKKKIIKMLISAAATVLVFALFFVFLIKQNSMVYLAHDDFGYATLSYVYKEEGIEGQNFDLEQLTHYLTGHYNRWGGRILSFAQEIILLQKGTDYMRAYNAISVAAIFILILCLAQRGKKSKFLPLSALFTVALFGILGREATMRGMYWYTASILYTVPVMYIFAGTLLLYVTAFGQAEKNFSLSKILMIPFCTVLFFFGAFSMEQVGIAAVMIAAAMCIYSCFKHRNPLMLIYTAPPLLASVLGYHILLMSSGNNMRKKMYEEYYSQSFLGQMLTGGRNIAETVFRRGNIAFVVLIAVVTLLCAYALIKKRKKNVFYKVLGGITALGAAFSVIIAAAEKYSGTVDALLWVYLVFMALTVSLWLFSSKSVGDFVIWCVFFGGLVSQAACLIAPVYFDSCFIVFFMSFAVVTVRMFAEVFDIFNKKIAVGTVCAACAVCVTAGGIQSAKIYNGFKSNVRVQEYNEAMLRYAGELYASGQALDEIPLMRLKNETYTSSTMPYDRELIKDWMKIYYSLPANLTYEDFVYEPYDETRLSELEEQLKQAKLKTE